MPELKVPGTVEVTIVLRGPINIAGLTQIPSMDHEPTPDDLEKCQRDALSGIHSELSKIKYLSDNAFKDLFADSPQIQSWLIYPNTVTGFDE